jgi:predicted HAD superfamily Cof-like phosphohydrolase
MTSHRLKDVRNMNNLNTVLSINEEYKYMDFIEAAELFNNISGQSTKVQFKDLSKQADLIAEEGYHEMNEALDNSDLVAVLDSAIDTLFVTVGMLQKLRVKGVNVLGAMKQVAQDNLSKYPTNMEVVKETIEMYKDKSVMISTSYDDTVGVYVIKNTNDKVMKPSNFIGTDLTKYVPEELINEFKKGN